MINNCPDKAFKLYLSTTRRLRPVSIKNYLSDLNHFWYWGQKQFPTQPFSTDKIDSLLLTNYKKSLFAQKLAEASIKRRLATVRVFCQFCLDQRWLKNNPALELENNIPNPSSDQKIDITLSQFGSFLRQTGSSKNTVKNYVADVRGFLTWAAGRN